MLPCLTTRCPSAKNLRIQLHRELLSPKSRSFLSSFEKLFMTCTSWTKCIGYRVCGISDSLYAAIPCMLRNQSQSRLCLLPERCKLYYLPFSIWQVWSLTQVYIRDTSEKICLKGGWEYRMKKCFKFLWKLKSTRRWSLKNDCDWWISIWYYGKRMEIFTHEFVYNPNIHLFWRLNLLYMFQSVWVGEIACVCSLI